MKTSDAVVATFGMTDEAWKRHANAWSVWTRFAGLVPVIAPIYFREALGWWALAIIGAGLVWLWLNPHVFRPIEQPRRWAEKGIFGEKLWAVDRSTAAATHSSAVRLLIGLAGVGALLMVYGLVLIEAWPTVFGVSLIVLAQLWRIDRFVAIYEEGLRRGQQ